VTITPGLLAAADRYAEAKVEAGEGTIRDWARLVADYLDAAKRGETLPLPEPKKPVRFEALNTTRHFDSLTKTMFEPVKDEHTGRLVAVATVRGPMAKVLSRRPGFREIPDSERLAMQLPAAAEDTDRAA
jgi:hypothetical protein